MRLGEDVVGDDHREHMGLDADRSVVGARRQEVVEVQEAVVCDQAAVPVRSKRLGVIHIQMH